MIESGTVVRVHEGLVDVRIAASEKCAGCGCCSAGDRGGMLLAGVRDSLGAKVGDSVEVVVPASSRTKAGLIAYGAPVALLVAGYVAGNLLGGMVGSEADITGAAGAIVAVATFYAVFAKRGKTLLVGEADQPRVRDIIARRRS